MQTKNRVDHDLSLLFLRFFCSPAREIVSIRDNKSIIYLFSVRKCNKEKSISRKNWVTNRFKKKNCFLWGSFTPVVHLVQLLRMFLYLRPKRNSAIGSERRDYRKKPHCKNTEKNNKKIKIKVLQTGANATFIVGQSTYFGFVEFTAEWNVCEWPFGTTGITSVNMKYRFEKMKNYCCI